MASTPLLLRQLLPYRLLPRISSAARQLAPATRSPLTAFKSTASTLPAFSTAVHHLSTSASSKMGHDSKTHRDATQGRRSIYQLTDKSTISDDRLKEIVEQALKNVPSSFNSQSTRLVVLVKDQHRKFWDFVTEILKGIVPEDQWEKTANRMKMFHGAYGSILFYEDPQVVKGMQEKFAIYADRFPPWSEHTNAMHQYYLWTALEAEGLGANLQHYNPLVNQRAADEWKIPSDWDLKAQLVFGTPAENFSLAEKTFEPIEKRLFFHGA